MHIRDYRTMSASENLRVTEKKKELRDNHFTVVTVNVIQYILVEQFSEWKEISREVSDERNDNK